MGDRVFFRFFLSCAICGNALLSASLSTTAWNTNSSGSWNTPINWTNGVPTSTSTVAFDLYPTGSIVVTPTTTMSAEEFALTSISGSVTISSTTYALTLSNAPAITISSGSLTLSPISITLNDNLSIDIASGKTLHTTVPITGAYNVALSDSGTWSCSGINTYTGTTTIGSGSTLTLLTTGSIADSSQVAVTGTLDISGTTSGTEVTTLSGAGTVTLGTKTLTISNGSTTSNNIISGDGGVTVSGGTQTFSGANTYTGATALSGVSTGLALSGASASIASSTSVSVPTGTELDLTALTSGATTIQNPSGGGLIDLGTNILTIAQSTNGSFAGEIISTGTGIIKSGSATLTLSGSSTYTGGTTVSAGILALSSSGTIASAGALAISSGATFSSAATQTIAGAISGSGTLLVTNNVLTLTNANSSFTGATTVTGGTLALSGSGAIASSTSVEVDGTFNISGISYTTAVITTLSGSGTVVLGGETLSISDGSTSFSGGISGTGGVTISGGTETLSGSSNSYSGTTTIDSGATLALSGSGSIEDSVEIAVASTGIFDISETSAGATIVTLSGAGTVTLGSNTLTISNGSTSFDNIISGSGGVTISGGTETFSGANVYTGTTTISGGTLVLSSSGSLYTLGAIVIESGATFSSAATQTLAGAISGVGALTVTANTLTLTNANSSYIGAATIDGGATLALSTAGSIIFSSGVEVDGTFDISATSSGATIATLSGSGIVALGSRTLNLRNADTTFSGVLEDGGLSGGIAGRLNLEGGTQTLSGANSYTGITSIGSGATLALLTAGSIATSSSVSVIGTFDVSATTTGAAITTLSGSGTVALGSKTLTISDADTTFTGVVKDGGLSGGVAGVLVLTTGTQTLSGINTYTGATTISGGTLSLSGSGSIEDSSGVSVTGTFSILSSSSGATIATLSGAGTVTLGAKTLTISDGSDTFSGAIGGTGGGVTVSGGTETLSGTNTYTGVTTISSGATLALLTAGSIATSSEVAATGTFNISGTTSGATISTLSSSGTVTLGSNTLTISAGSTTFSGAIAGTGILTLSSGTQTLSGTNTYTGGTIISGGTLATSGSGTLDATSDIIISSGATFSMAASGGQTISTGVISGHGAVAVSAGTLTLSSANSYDGGTTIGASGTLALGSGGSLASLGALTLSSSSATFNISGASADQAIGALSGVSSSTITLGSNRLTSYSTTTTTFSGAIGGTDGFTKIGSGTLHLAGTNTYTGSTLITAGELAIDGSITSDVTVASGATLSGIGTITGDVDVFGTIAPGSSPGTLTIVDGTLTLDSASTTEIELSPTETSLIAVTGLPGTATLDGTLSVTLDSGYYTAGTVTILSTEGGISGTFSTTSLDLTPGLTGSVSYTTDDVLLTLSINALTAPSGLTGNAKSFFDYLNSLYTNPAYATIFQKLAALTLTEAQQEKFISALIELQPSRDAILTFVASNAQFDVADVISNHSASRRFCNFTEQAPSRYLATQTELQSSIREGELLASNGPFIARKECPKPHNTVVRMGRPDDTYDVWLDTFGDISHLGSANQNPSFTGSTIGALLGMDHFGPEQSLLGCAAGAMRSKVVEADDQGSQTANYYFAALHTTCYLGTSYIELGLLGAYDQLERERDINFSLFSGTATSSSNMWQVTPHLSMGRFFWGVNYSIEPFITADWAFNFEQENQEHGIGELDIVIASRTSSLLRSEAGFNIYWDWRTQFGSLFLLKGTAAYVNKLPFNLGAMTASLVQVGGSFQVNSFTEMENLWTAGLEFLYRANNGLFVGMDYQGEFGSGYYSNEIQAKFGWSF